MLSQSQKEEGKVREKNDSLSQLWSTQFFFKKFVAVFFKSNSIASGVTMYVDLDIVFLRIIM
jgi:hypothetical protein